MSNLLTVKEVAALLRVRSTKWVYQHKFEIPGYVELAGSHLFDADVLQESLKQRALKKTTSKRPKGYNDNRHGGVSIFCNRNDNTENKVNNPPSTKKNIEENSGPAKIQSVEDATKYAVGSGQYTGTEYSSVLGWEKYALKTDKKFDFYRAMPKDGKWTYKASGTWEVGMDRYSNTGQKYYFVELSFKDKSFVGWRFAFQNSETIISSVKNSVED